MFPNSRYQALLWLTFVPSLGLAQAPTPATQVHPVVRRGIFSTTPVAILENSSGPSEILIVNPGGTPGAPAPWTTARFGATTANYADYSLDALFGVGNPNDVRLAAISTGNDQIPEFNSEGQFIPLGYDLWFGLTVSVSNAAVGASNSHPARVFANGADSPGAELFTYFMEESEGIEESLVHTTVSERSRETLGFVVPPNTAPADRVDVRGIDHALGLIAFDRNVRGVDLFEQRRRFYFTLDPANLASYAPNFAILKTLTFSDPATVDADAATIYECEWVDIPTGGHGWSLPRVYREASELGLNPATDSIDALSVDTESGRVIYSTQVVTGRSQILAHYPIPNGPTMHTKPLKTHDGVLMTVHLGLTEPDDVDGTCGIDPEIIQPSDPAYSGVIGIPEPNPYITPNDVPLGLSVVIVDGVAPAIVAIKGQVTGLAPNGSNDLLVYVFTDRPAGLSAIPDLYFPWNFLSAELLAPGTHTTNLTVPINYVFPKIDMAVCALQFTIQPDASVVKTRTSWVCHFSVKTLFDE